MQGAVREGRELAHLGTVIVDTWRSRQLRAVRGELSSKTQLLAGKRLNNGTLNRWLADAAVVLLAVVEVVFFPVLLFHTQHNYFNF